MRDLLAAFLAALGFTAPLDAGAQMIVDTNFSQVRQATGSTYLEDLAVHDTAFFYAGNVCVKDSRLYVSAWTEPQNLATWKHEGSGIIAKAEVLPTKQLRILLVDELQAQKQAQGRVGEKSNMSKADYDGYVRVLIGNIFNGGFFGGSACEEQQRQNPLRPPSFFAVESINGFSKLSELLESVSSNQPRTTGLKPK